MRGQIDRCPAPCERPVDPDAYATMIAPVADAIDGDARAVIGVLEARLAALSRQQRFEEAAGVREHIRALVESLRRVRAAAMLARGGTIRLVIGSSTVTITDGDLTDVDGRALPAEADGHPDERRLISAWIARNLHRIRLISCDGALADPIGGGRELAAWAARLKELTRARPTDGDRRHRLAVG